MDFVDFGETGLRVSRLAFGTGTRGWAGRSEQTDLGVDRLASLLRLAYDHGVNFWDAADESTARIPTSRERCRESLATKW